MTSYRITLANIQPPHYACQTQAYKDGHRDALNSVFELVTPIDMELATLRGLLREIVTAKNVAMPIEMEDKINDMLNGRIQPVDEEAPCTGHKWKSHMNPSTPDSPAEWFEFCDICGTEKQEAA